MSEDDGLTYLDRLKVQIITDWIVSGGKATAVLPA